MRLTFSGTKRRTNCKKDVKKVKLEATSPTAPVSQLLQTFNASHNMTANPEAASTSAASIIPCWALAALCCGGAS